MKKINISRANQLDALLELLVRNLAQQRASTKIIIELLRDSDEDIKRVYEDLNEYTLREDEAVRDFVYAQFGELNLNDLTGDEENK